MPKFNVTKVSTRQIEVEAKDAEEAQDKVHKLGKKAGRAIGYTANYNAQEVREPAKPATAAPVKPAGKSS